MRALGGCLRKLLHKVGLYERAKASLLYDFYWKMVDPEVLRERRTEIEFYRHVLQGFHPGDLIFDIGANQGYKTDIFLRLGARVVAVEPDDICKEVLRQRFLAFRLKKKPVAIVAKAVSDRSFVETMWVDAAGSAKNTLSQKWVQTLRGDATRFGHRLDFGQRKEVETITLEQLFNSQGLPFFVKIDVEGYEPSVLRGMRRPVPYLSFEVNLPEFKAEGLECIQLLGRLAPDGKFNYTADCKTGLAFEQWLDREEISARLDSCSESSIEVFWRTSVPCGTK